MGKTVGQIDVQIRKYAADAPKVAADLPKHTAKLKELDSKYCAWEKDLLARKKAIDEAAAKEIKAIMEEAAKDKKDLDKAFNAQVKASMYKEIENIAAAGNVGKGCAAISKTCDGLLAELKKADGDKEARKKAEVLASKTSRDYASLAKQYGDLNVTATKLLRSIMSS